MTAKNIKYFHLTYPRESLCSTIVLQEFKACLNAIVDEGLDMVRELDLDNVFVRLRLFPMRMQRRPGWPGRQCMCRCCPECVTYGRCCNVYAYCFCCAACIGPFVHVATAPETGWQSVSYVGTTPNEWHVCLGDGSQAVPQETSDAHPGGIWLICSTTRHVVCLCGVLACIAMMCSCDSCCLCL